MFRLATQPQSIARVLDSGIRLFTTSLGGVIGFAFLASAIGVIPSIVMELILSQTITTETVGLATLIIGYVVVLLVTIVLYSAIVVRVGFLAKGQPLTAGAALGLAARRAPRILLIGVLYALAVTVGLILLVIPGFIVALTLFFGMTIALLENERAVPSLRHSHRLVWGNWWRTATVMTVPFAIYLVLYVALFAVFGVVIGFSAQGSGEPGAMLFLYGGEAIITALAMPLLNSVTIVQYFDLKMRKEGADLGSRIDTLAAAQ